MCAQAAGACAAQAHAQDRGAPAARDDAAQRRREPEAAAGRSPPSGLGQGGAPFSGREGSRTGETAAPRPGAGAGAGAHKAEPGAARGPAAASAGVPGSGSAAGGASGAPGGAGAPGGPGRGLPGGLLSSGQLSCSGADGLRALESTLAQARASGGGGALQARAAPRPSDRPRRAALVSASSIPGFGCCPGHPLV